MKREYIEPGIEITYFVTESVMEGEPNIMLLSLNDPTVDPTDMGGTETKKVAGINLADIQ